MSAEIPRADLETIKKVRAASEQERTSVYEESYDEFENLILPDAIDELFEVRHILEKKMATIISDAQLPTLTFHLSEVNDRIVTVLKNTIASLEATLANAKRSEKAGVEEKLLEFRGLFENEHIRLPVFVKRPKGYLDNN